MPASHNQPKGAIISPESQEICSGVTPRVFGEHATQACRCSRVKVFNLQVIPLQDAYRWRMIRWRILQEKIYYHT